MATIDDYNSDDDDHSSLGADDDDNVDAMVARNGGGPSRFMLRTGDTDADTYEDELLDYTRGAVGQKRARGGAAEGRGDSDDDDMDADDLDVDDADDDDNIAIQQQEYDREIAEGDEEYLGDDVAADSDADGDDDDAADGDGAGDDDDDDAADTDPDQYLKKFRNAVHDKHLTNFHPECRAVNYQEIEIYTSIVRNGDNIVIDPLHKTVPFLTKYEETRVLGIRTMQLEAGALAFVTVPEGMMEAHLIARLELEAKKIPFVLKRPMPNGGFEYWRLQDLEMIR